GGHAHGLVFHIRCNVRAAKRFAARGKTGMELLEREKKRKREGRHIRVRSRIRATSVYPAVKGLPECGRIPHVGGRQTQPTGPTCGIVPHSGSPARIGFEVGRSAHHIFPDRLSPFPCALSPPSRFRARIFAFTR